MTIIFNDKLQNTLILFNFRITYKTESFICVTFEKKQIGKQKSRI